MVWHVYTDRHVARLLIYRCLILINCYRRAEVLLQGGRAGGRGRGKENGRAVVVDIMSSLSTNLSDVRKPYNAVD